jgi:hypothetical protein
MLESLEHGSIIFWQKIQVLIPKTVFQEVVVEGKRLGEKDAYRVEKAIAQGWLYIKSQGRQSHPQKSYEPIN